MYTTWRYFTDEEKAEHQRQAAQNREQERRDKYHSQFERVDAIFSKHSKRVIELRKQGYSRDYCISFLTQFHSYTFERAVSEVDAVIAMEAKNDE
jgi:hypothetical protein